MTTTNNAPATKLRASVIRPGLIVSLRTSIRGGVSYATNELEHANADGRDVKRWETVRQIADVREHERATVTRSKCRSLIVAECIHSSFGLLCPNGKEQALWDALTEAQRIANEFNETAQHTRIEVNVLAGRVAATDQQATEAIAAEVRELIDAMESGVQAADPEAIRESATKAKRLAAMLSDDAQDAVSRAVEEVRGVARAIVRRVEKAGERAADVIAEQQLQALTAARFAVLDVDNDGEREAVTVQAVAPAIELEPEPEDAAVVALRASLIQKQAAQIDLEAAAMQE